MKLAIPLMVIALFLGIGATYLAMRRIEPPQLSFKDVPLDTGNELLAKVKDDPTYQEVIQVPSGSKQAVLWYVGQVIVKGSKDGVPSYTRLGNFRPSPEEVTITPEDEKLYSGVIASNLALKGGITEVVGELGVDEAAELVISNTMEASYSDASKEPYQRLQSVVIEPGHEYFFVDSVILTTATYRKYHKVKAGGTINGLAFSANGNMYASAESFGVRRYLCLRMISVSRAQTALREETSQPLKQIDEELRALPSRGPVAVAGGYVPNPEEEKLRKRSEEVLRDATKKVLNDATKIARPNIPSEVLQQLTQEVTS
jgi:hypothetical protein